MQRLIDHEHILEGLLSVCCKEDEVQKKESDEANNIPVYRSPANMIVPLERGMLVIRD